jgi:hypothetical protein
MFTFQVFVGVRFGNLLSAARSSAQRVDQEGE